MDEDPSKQINKILSSMNATKPILNATLIFGVAVYSVMFVSWKCDVSFQQNAALEQLLSNGTALAGLVLVACQNFDNVHSDFRKWADCESSYNLPDLLIDVFALFTVVCVAVYANVASAATLHAIVANMIADETNTYSSFNTPAFSFAIFFVSAIPYMYSMGKDHLARKADIKRR